jgi:hypothetical protein
MSILAIALGAACAGLIAMDVARRPQQMWIMNIVWPVTALFAGPISVWGYWRYGRLATHQRAEAAKRHGEEPPSKRLTPFPAMVAKGAAHCGSGCTLGDICAEWLVFLAPAIAIWFGWGSLFGEKMFAVWIVDYMFAFAFGVAFQYFTITPMRGLSPGAGLIEAVKADAASLTAWQLGMYAFMAFASLYLFRHVLGVQLLTSSFEFWFMMQIAMLCGFVTSYPMNWWLISAGIKERM